MLLRTLYILSLLCLLLADLSSLSASTLKSEGSKRHFIVDDPTTPEDKDAEVEVTEVVVDSDESFADTTVQLTEGNEDIVFVNLTSDPTIDDTTVKPDVIDHNRAASLKDVLNVSSENLKLTFIRASFVGGMVFTAVFAATVDQSKAMHSMLVPSIVTAWLALANPGYREWLVGEGLSPFMGRLPIPGLKHIPIPYVLDPTKKKTPKIASMRMQIGKMAGFLAVYLSLLHLSDKVYEHGLNSIAYLTDFSKFYSLSDLKRIFASVMESLPGELIFLSLNGQLFRKSLDANPTKENLKRLEKWSARASTVVSMFLTAGQVASVVSDSALVTIGNYQLNEGSMILHAASTLGAGFYFLKLTKPGQKLVSAFKSGCQTVFGTSGSRPFIIP